MSVPFSFGLARMLHAYNYNVLAAYGTLSNNNTIEILIETYEVYYTPRCEIKDPGSMNNINKLIATQARGSVGHPI